MEYIIKWLQMPLVKALLEWDLSPLAGKERDKLRLSPEKLLQVIHAQALAEWSLAMAQRFSCLRLYQQARQPSRHRDKLDNQPCPEPCPELALKFIEELALSRRVELVETLSKGCRRGVEGLSKGCSAGLWGANENEQLA